MDIDEYLAEVRRLWITGQATEHSYRPALQALFRAIDPALDVIDEPKKSEGGMPDVLFRRNAISIGWAEAKDLDKDVIRLKGYSVEQRRRYEAAYLNLLYTNGVDSEQSTATRSSPCSFWVEIRSSLTELLLSTSPATTLRRETAATQLAD